MGRTHDDGRDRGSRLDRAARMVLVLTVLGACLGGVAVADGATAPAPATPAAAADPGLSDPAEAAARMPLPSATGPAAGAGLTAGLGVAAGLFSRFGREE